MAKNKLVWVVRNDNFAIICPDTKPVCIPDDGANYWDGGMNQIDVCYKQFKRVTGLNLEIDHPIRVRFNVEVYTT